MCLSGTAEMCLMAGLLQVRLMLCVLGAQESTLAETL